MKGEGIITWVRAAIDDDIVENLVGSGRSVRGFFLAVFTDEFLDKVSFWVPLFGLGTHDSAF